jgi:outer membrane protein OmpA-like peptidoglycan-associated protein
MIFCSDSEVALVKRVLCLLVLASLSLGGVGCGAYSSPSSRELGILSGGALGAGLGAVVGNQVGDSGPGIAIGSAFGAVAGGLIGNALDGRDSQLSDRSERIQEQEDRLAENRKIIEELRARGADAYETERGVVINLPDVLFAFDSYELTSEAYSTVREIVNSAQATPTRRLAVEGHTDSVGNESYNLALSQRRADAVSKALKAKGVVASRLSTRGFGEAKPLAPNTTAVGRQRNRRVEVILEN